MIYVRIFWTDGGKRGEQSVRLPSVPVHGDQVITEEGYEGTVASRTWLLKPDQLEVHVVLT